MCFNISTDIILQLTTVFNRRAAAICQCNHNRVHGNVEPEMETSHKKSSSQAAVLRDVKPFILLDGYMTLHPG